jgi:hypothetical protein
MLFKIGSLVTLKVDRQFENKVFQAGTSGIIAAGIDSMAAYLVVLGHDGTTRLLPESVLDPLSISSKAKTQGAASMRFDTGDRVRLVVDRVFEDRTYPKGSTGQVREQLVVFMSYLVDFDIDSTDRVIHDSALEAE